MSSVVSLSMRFSMLVDRWAARASAASSRPGSARDRRRGGGGAPMRGCACQILRGLTLENSMERTAAILRLIWRMYMSASVWA